MTIQLGLGLADPGASAIWTRDDGAVDDPHTDGEWREWVGPGAIRHWCDGDPLLDWLDLYGEASGFVRDDRSPSYDPRLDLLRVIGERGARFEELVLSELDARHGLTRIASGPEDSRSADAARATWQALRSGDPLVAGAVLRDPQLRTYGVADLLVRSDVLLDLFPAALDEEEEPVVALALPGQRWHYRVVDVRYTTLELLKDGAISTSSELGVSAKLWILNNALGRLQGAAPPHAYVLARGWRRGALRGTSCWDRLGRVSRDAFVRSQERWLAQVVAEAATWVRRLRREGSSWQVQPVPSVPELWPNMKVRYDAPWQRARRELAERLSELTLVAHIGPRIRTAAHARGVTRLDDPRASAAFLGLGSSEGAAIVDAILQVDRSRDGQYVRPARVTADGEAWRPAAALECYVDFETVNDALDDLSTFPERGGQSLIFQIGCGRRLDGEWEFRRFTARALTPESEADMIDDFIAHLRELALAAGLGSVGAIRLFHWSAAETSAIDNAYRSARRRHRERDWPELGWYDLLEKVIRAEPIVVRGAHGFGLKAVTNAMFRHGLIATRWPDALSDGGGAMAAAWSAWREAELRGLALEEIDLMREVDRYNEIDCRAMAEVLDHLRSEH